MSIVLNDPLCTALGGNTGTPGCALNPKAIVGAMLIPDDKVFDSSDMASLSTFIAAVQALTLSGVGTRVYPIFRFDSITDNTEDVSVKTLGYGSKKVAKEGKYDFTFEINTGICHNNNLRLFNDRRDLKVIFFDKDNQVHAVKYGTDGSITGFTLDFFYAYPVKMDDGGENPAAYRLRFALAKPREYNEDVAIFQLGSDPETVFKGILDVELYLISQAAGYVNVGIRTVCDRISLYDAYSTDLADKDLYVLTKAGAGVTISGVTAVPGIGPNGEGGWKIETSTPSGDHVLALVSASALATGGVGGAPDEGYEAIGTLAVTW